MICQLYLIWRIYKFTKAWFWLPLLIAPVLASLLGTSLLPNLLNRRTLTLRLSLSIFVGAIQTGYGAITITLAGRATLTKWVTVWLSGKVRPLESGTFGSPCSF